MPELPDITLYIEALHSRIAGKRLEKIRLASPFLLRTVDPPIGRAEGRMILALHRVGKQIVWELEEKYFLVFHLMIAGRFHWKKRGAAIGGKGPLAAFDVPDGSVVLTEAASKKRASMHLVHGNDALRQFERGGLELWDSSPSSFREALLTGNHTLKRALTDPRLFSGIGNAYSDEILHRARLSPLQKTKNLSAAEVARLRRSAIQVMEEWISRLREQSKGEFPEKVTAFRPEMAVHGKFGKPCPVCGSAIQHIVYAENECDYCPRCQTGGKILADRSLSRLLKEDWPSTIEELEANPALSRSR